MRSSPPITGKVGPIPPPSQGCDASMPASISAMCAGRPPPGRRRARGSAAGSGAAASAPAVVAWAGARNATGTTATTSGSAASDSRRPEGSRTPTAFTSTRDRKVTVAPRLASTGARASWPSVTARAAAARPSGAARSGRGVPEQEDRRLGVAGRRQLGRPVGLERVPPPGRRVEGRRAHGGRVGGRRDRNGTRRRSGLGGEGRRCGDDHGGHPERERRAAAAGAAGAHAAIPPGGAVATASRPR